MQDVKHPTPEEEDPPSLSATEKGLVGWTGRVRGGVKGRGVLVFGYVGASFHIRTVGKQSE